GRHHSIFSSRRHSIDSRFLPSYSAHRPQNLVLCNRYGFTIATRSLGEFGGASEAPASAAILAERGTREFAQGTAARRVELKMDRRPRCFSVAGRKGTCSLVAPWRRAILNSTILKAYRLHNTGSSSCSQQLSS